MSALADIDGALAAKFAEMGSRPAMTVRAHELRACLPDLADRTHFQLSQLYDDCTLDRCDLLVRALQEVTMAVRQLAAELDRDETPTV